MAVTRLTGMVSGMDTDTLVKNLMRAERAPLDKLVQKKQSKQWTEDAYREINTKVFDLRTQVMNMKLKSSYKVYSANSSDANSITATAVGGAIEGTYKVTVDRLASAAERKSASTVSPELTSSSDITNFNVQGKELNITYNGVQKTISWASTEGAYSNIGELAAGLQSKIDNVFGANQLEVYNNGVDDKLTLRPKDATFKPDIKLNSGGTDVDALAQMNFTDGQKYHISLDTKLTDLVLRTGSLSSTVGNQLDFTINGQNFVIDNTKTLGDLINQVNSDIKADVTMTYDTTTDKFSIKRDSTGAGMTIDVSDNNSSDLLTKLGVTGLAAFTDGTNAIVDITDPSGLTMTNLEMSSNTFNIKGISMTLLNADSQEKTISVSKDVDTVYNNIKSLIDKYNDTISFINTKYTEEKYNDYAPLTDEQREAMTEDQISKWEEKAKSGLLKSDNLIGGLLNDMRTSIGNIVSGLTNNYNHITDVGITTGAYYENGKLNIDETKLKQAISDNIDDVTNFFSYSPTNLQSSNLSGILNVDGKDLKITLNQSQQTINLSGSYDMANAADVTNLKSEIQGKIDNAFGKSQMTVSISNNQIILTSNKGYSVKLNSGSNDALSVLGFNDNDMYDSSKKGIMSKLYDKLVIGTSKLVDKAGSAASFFDNSVLGKELSSINAEITDKNSRLADIEERYYAQFTAMETALQKMNQQSTWLSQQLGSSK